MEFKKPVAAGMTVPTMKAFFELKRTTTWTTAMLNNYTLSLLKNAAEYLIILDQKDNYHMIKMSSLGVLADVEFLVANASGAFFKLNLSHDNETSATLRVYNGTNPIIMGDAIKEMYRIDPTKAVTV